MCIADIGMSLTPFLPGQPATITEPLRLLCAIEILRKIHPAVFAHIKTSAVYCFAVPYCKKRIRLEVVLTPKMENKLTFAGLLDPQVIQSHFNRRHIQ